MSDQVQTFQIGDLELELQTSSEVFCPNLTTSRIAQTIEGIEGKAVLDLGCGCGPLAIYLAKHGAGKVTAVDVVPRAAQIAAENVKRHGLEDKVTVYCGDLFAPISDQKFDVIVNDVSGIAELPGRAAGWYPKDVPTGGEDGANVVIRMFQNVKNHLNPGGVLYFATSSLSNVQRILDAANEYLGQKIEELGAFRIPFSKELTDVIDELTKLCEQGAVSFESKRSRYLWTLSVFRVQMP
jgi:methylase of polypeptide subunit release factors